MSANPAIANNGACTGLLPPHVHSMLYHSGLLAPEFLPEQQQQQQQQPSLQVRGDSSTHPTIKGVRRQLNPPTSAFANDSGNSQGQSAQQQQQQQQRRYDVADDSGLSGAGGSATHLHPSKAGAPSASVLDSPFFQRVNNATPSSSAAARTPSQIRCTPWAAEANHGKGAAMGGSTSWSYLDGATPAGLTPSAYGRRSAQQGLSASPGTPHHQLQPPPPSHHQHYHAPGGSGSAQPSPVAALSGVALERQLMQASKEELVQILLDLGSCSAEAGAFIHTKARFFAMRHGELDDELDRMAGPSTRRALQLQESSTQFSLRPTPTRDAAVEVGAIGGGSPITAPPSAVRGAHPDTRPFCTELHPCLRWYGGCRNSTSCIFAAAPQNLCLNWARGSCAAGAACSGVHRLPDSCSAEVRRVYELNHGGVDRAALLHQQQPLPPSPPRTPQTPRGQALRPCTSSPQPHHSPFYDYREDLVSSGGDEEERAAAAATVEDGDLGAEAAQAMSVVCRCLQSSFSRAATEEEMNTAAAHHHCSQTDNNNNDQNKDVNESSCSLSLIYKEEGEEEAMGATAALPVSPPPPAPPVAESAHDAREKRHKKHHQHHKKAGAKAPAAAAEEEGYNSPLPAPGDRTREHTPEPERKH